MKMFGFLIRGQVNDDLVKLLSLTEVVLEKYGKSSLSEIRAAIIKDFSEHERYVDSQDCNFNFGSLPEFLFSFTKGIGGEAPTLLAHGRGKYAGFLLHAKGDKSAWFCSCSDRVAYAATGGARMMAKICEQKFGIENIERTLSKLGIR